MTPAPAETLKLLPESTPVLRFVYISGAAVLSYPKFFKKLNFFLKTALRSSSNTRNGLYLQKGRAL